MKNSADLGECYPRLPSASVDNTLLDLQNSSYPTQPRLITAKYYMLKGNIIALLLGLVQTYSDIFDTSSDSSSDHTHPVNPDILKSTLRVALNESARNPITCQGGNF